MKSVVRELSVLFVLFIAIASVGVMGTPVSGENEVGQSVVTSAES